MFPLKFDGFSISLYRVFSKEPFKPLFSNITVYRIMDKFLNVFNLSWCYIVEKYDKSNNALEFLDFHFDNVLSWFFVFDIWQTALRFWISLRLLEPLIVNMPLNHYSGHYLRKLIGFWIHINQWAKLCFIIDIFPCSLLYYTS